jgi:hypothetical protein
MFKDIKEIPIGTAIKLWNVVLTETYYIPYADDAGMMLLFNWKAYNG